MKDRFISVQCLNTNLGNHGSDCQNLPAVGRLNRICYLIFSFFVRYIKQLFATVSRIKSYCHISVVRLIGTHLVSYVNLMFLLLIIGKIIQFPVDIKWSEIVQQANVGINYYYSTTAR